VIRIVYCDDPSHCADPVGLYITDPNPVLSEGVYLVPIRASHIRGGRILPDRNDGQVREITEDGIVLPPKGRRLWARPGQPLPDPRLLETQQSWSPRCRARTPAGRRCGQSGGRWKGDDLDKLFAQLAEELGATGVSLRALDLIKHGGLRSIR
jgi:hypothetical protein